MTVCEWCGAEVWPQRSGTWRQVVGWVEQRGATGGAHGIHAQEDTGRYACDSCMALVRRGIDPAQGALL